MNDMNEIIIDDGKCFTHENDIRLWVVSPNSFVWSWIKILLYQPYKYLYTDIDIRKRLKAIMILCSR